MPLELGPAIVIILRLVIPMTMFRWPVGGMFAGILADNFDTILLSLIGHGTFENYTLTDKLLDTYLLMFFVYFSLRWENEVARYTSLALFWYRLVGVVVLSEAEERWLLFFFPNVFEFFFIYQLVTMKWWPHLQVNGYRVLALVLPVLLSLKLIQEYIVHVAELHLMCSLYVNTLEFTEPYLGSGFKEFAEGYLKSWC